MTRATSPTTTTPPIPGLRLIYEFLTPPEEHHIQHHIYSEPPSPWVTLSHRRLLWYGTPASTDVAPPHKYRQIHPLPSCISSIAQRLHAQGHQTHRANHVLVNEYRPGQGIMPHEDGPAYEPEAAIVSLLSAIDLDWYDKRIESRHRPVYSAYLLPRSLLLISGAAYTDYLHGIAECDVNRNGEPRQLRLSLTLRHAKSVQEEGGEEAGPYVAPDARRHDRLAAVHAFERITGRKLGALR
ncbi:hypothetical protein CDCA_CDCA08G2327 [Cyanidium caldarium]|uniref:Fe2OG dioxygenase domain-containing protein n=1 Tax=Cyanidium caldarium TaxID=2771 RepID=A0AAV9IVL7_CYACA|nr:hypothetical protein CDCA_CDCA08G2327 [Cyanidium caldarium]|eukprot:ctg_205.g81